MGCVYISGMYEKKSPIATLRYLIGIPQAFIFKFIWGCNNFAWPDVFKKKKNRCLDEGEIIQGMYIINVQSSFVELLEKS